MALLLDTRDPTIALFMSYRGAAAAAVMVKRMYPKTVHRCEAKPRFVRGAFLGYVCVAHKTDGSSAPITNSDFERVSEHAE